MGCLKGFVMAILIIFLLIFNSVFLSSLAMENTLYNEDFYIDMVIETDAVAKLHESLFDFLPDMMSMDVADQSQTTSQEVEDLISVVFIAGLERAFSHEWVEDTFFLLIHDIMDYVDGDANTIDTVIDVSSRKPVMEQALIEEFSALTDQQLASLDIDRNRIPTVVRDMVHDLDFFQDIELKEFMDELHQQDTYHDVMDRMRATRTYMRTIPYILYAVVLVLCCVTIGIAGGLKAFGIVTFLSGLGFFGTFQFARVMMRTMLSQNIQQMMGDDLPVEQLDLEIVFDIVSFTVNRITQPALIFIWVGVIVFLIGLFVGFIWKKNRPQTPPQQPPQQPYASSNY